MIDRWFIGLMHTRWRRKIIQEINESLKIFLQSQQKIVKRQYNAGSLQKPNESVYARIPRRLSALAVPSNKEYDIMFIGSRSYTNL